MKSLSATIASVLTVHLTTFAVRTSVLTDQRVYWISTYGGRFIALPDSSLDDWHGCPDDGRAPLDLSHDYGRACATSGYADLLPVGKTHALLFGENKLGGVWLDSTYPILFEWIYAESESEVVKSLERLPADLEVNASLSFVVSADHLHVFDSAFSGSERETQHSCRFPIQPGSYTINSSIYEPNDNTGLIIHRFEPA